ncbi:MAG TPA: ABC transporter permease, partial [Dehalococcoidales bacterium]
RRKGFIITTLSMPVLGLLGILIFQLVTGLTRPSSDEITRIGFIDQTGIFTQYTEQNKIIFISYSSEETANSDLAGGNIQEYFVIPSDYINTGIIDRFSMKTELQPPAEVINATQSFLVSNLLKDNVSPEIAARVRARLAVNNTILDKTGSVADNQGGTAGLMISYVFSVLLIVAIFTASGYLLQGLSEEKENRIMELLLSSVSTRQLITGKVLALGTSGLIQILVWLISGYGLIALGSSSIGGFFTTLHFPVSVVALSVIYFILGYFLFAILMAGIGAIAPTQRDGQQMSVVFTLFSAIPYFLMLFIVENGEHVVSRILTIFPLTAPLTVMIRLNNGIPIWEILTSVVVLILAIYGSLLLVSKIFRVYLLMYGKTPGWSEIVKSLRQSA